MTKDATSVSDEQDVEAGSEDVVTVAEEMEVEIDESAESEEADVEVDAAEVDVDEEGLSDEDIISQLEEQLATALAERDEADDRRLREAAEFQNTRRRQERQLADEISRANASLIRTLLPVLDDFDLAFQNAPGAADDVSDGNSEQLPWIAGFEQIQKKLLGLLEEQGVSPIEANGVFDPSLHEAVLSEPSDDVECGHVISVLRAGYEYKGQVLRPAMVRVAA